MVRRRLLRGVAILCLRCLCNLAYHRAGWSGSKPIFAGAFLRAANGNFLDICVLEWCKLFGEPRGNHYWRKVITDPESFLAGLLKGCEVTETQLEESIRGIRAYRDKFLAHLDREEVMQIPKLEIVKSTASYLYDYLLAHEDEGGFFTDGPTKASIYYAEKAREGAKGYES